MNNKRVYIMDCGGFIKIGISNNVDKRKNQIDYPVKQYYSTEPIDNALEIEKYIKDELNPYNRIIIGLLYLKTNRKIEAKITFDDFIEQHPDLIIAQDVKALLNSI